MLQTIIGQQPFQVLATNFSISPSNEGYDLQISSDGFNYSTLFSVGAGITRMVTGISNGSYFRLLGNESEVVINWNKQCNGGGGGGGEYILPVASETTLGGIKVGDGLAIDANGVLSTSGSSEGGDSHILLASSATPAGLQDGDVFAEAVETTVPAPSEQLFTEVTVPYGSTFYWYYGGQYSELVAGVHDDGTGYGPFGDAVDGVIEGPWGASASGIEVEDNGDGTVNLTSTATDASYLVQMFNFSPAINVPAGTQFGIKQKQGQADVWVAFAANEFEYVREDLGGDGDYLMHWDNDNLFKGVTISSGDFSPSQGYGMSMGADGKMHCTDPDYPNITAWIEGGKLYWNNPYGVISMLDAYQVGSNLQGCSGQTDVYSNAVMSQQVTKIWKGNAEEYAALGGNVSEDTLYIII